MSARNDMDRNPVDAAVLVIEKATAIIEQDKMRLKFPLVNFTGQFQMLSLGAAVVERRKDPDKSNGF